MSNHYDGDVRLLNEEGGGEHEEEHDVTFGFENHAWTREEQIILAEYLLVFLVLLVATLYIQYFVGKIWKLSWLPESGATILFGMVIGLIVRIVSGGGGTAATMLEFNSTIFFLAFLPPIIFNAGYMLNRRLFFANLGGIMGLVIIGTTTSSFIVALGLWALGKSTISHHITFMETLCFGALISSTDPVSTIAVFTQLKVDPTLFYLVFGESVLNDAVAITLFRAASKYVGMDTGSYEAFVGFVDFWIVFIGSVVIGSALGLLSAWLFKQVDMNHHNHILVTIFVAQVYIPYFLCECLQLSGIVAIAFTAITAKRYSNRNMDRDAKHQCAFVFEVLSYISETSVFLYLGLNVFSESATHSYHFGFIFWTSLLCIIGRAVHVYPIMMLANRYRVKRAKKKNRTPILIGTNTMHMVVFSGLRGSVAYALANIFPDTYGNRDIVLSTSIVIALITVFGCGGATPALLGYLKIEMGVDPQPFADRLKVSAKPFRLLLWEQRNIYPWIIRNFNPATDMDISSEKINLGGHGEEVHGHGGSANVTLPGQDDYGDVEMDGNVSARRQGQHVAINDDDDDDDDDRKLFSGRQVKSDEF